MLGSTDAGTQHAQTLIIRVFWGGLISLGRHCASVQREIPDTQIPNLGGRCWSVKNKQENSLQDV